MNDDTDALYDARGEAEARAVAIWGPNAGAAYFPAAVAYGHLPCEVWNGDPENPIHGSGKDWDSAFANARPVPKK